MDWNDIRTLPETDEAFSDFFELTDLKNTVVGRYRYPDAWYGGYAPGGYVDENDEDITWTPTHWRPIHKDLKA